MSILIEGMEMPETGCYFVCVDNSNGKDKTVITVARRIGNTSDRYVIGSYELVPVPPHGRLIDADALRAKQQEDADLFQGSTAYGDKCRRDEAMNAVANIVNAPTIIPASFENLPKNARYSQDNPAEEGE